MTLTLLVAMDAARGIGIENRLPWKLAEDMAFFKRTTTGNTVIMGRKTYDSIGRPLPNRRNIVISRDPLWQAAGVEAANSVEAALARLAQDENAFVIGGAQIYALTLPLAQRLLVTEIDKNFACDAFFPALQDPTWHETSREQHFSTQNDCHFAFVEYQR